MTEALHERAIRNETNLSKGDEMTDEEFEKFKAMNKAAVQPDSGYTKLCAEIDRLKNDMGTVKQAREMTDRAMASAKAWEEQALEKQKERDAAFLQIDEFKEGEAQDRQVMDEFAREFFGGQEGKLWLPGFTLKKLLEMVRDRFAIKRKEGA